MLRRHGAGGGSRGAPGAFFPERPQLPAAHPAFPPRVHPSHPGDGGQPVNEPLPPDFQELCDEYLEGSLSEERLRLLTDMLRGREEARRHFVRYAQLHTDLHLLARAERAGRRALRRLEALDERQEPAAAGRGPRARWHAPRFAAGLAALALLALGLWVLRGGGGRPAAPAAAGNNLAWLTNAQDCQWAESMAPAVYMGAGKVLRVKRGLAEVGFASGAQVVLEGPASLEILSASSARLLSGRVT